LFFLNEFFTKFDISSISLSSLGRPLFGYYFPVMNWHRKDVQLSFIVIMASMSSFSYTRVFKL